jgi:FAD-linked sulfhydryl oxidase
MSRCRSCVSKTDFMTWASETKNRRPQAEGPIKTENLKTQLYTPGEECPADVNTLGKSTWVLLHTIAATYPEYPTSSQRSDLLAFIQLFSRIYPCSSCAGDFEDYTKRSVPKVTSRTDFGRWLCDAHNDVNKKLGKPIFNCDMWQERWRTGPPDGSCG